MVGLKSGYCQLPGVVSVIPCTWGDAQKSDLGACPRGMTLGPNERDTSPHKRSGDKAFSKPRPFRDGAIDICDRDDPQDDAVKIGTLCYETGRDGRAKKAPRPAFPIQRGDRAEREEKPNRRIELPQPPPRNAKRTDATRHAIRLDSYIRTNRLPLPAPRHEWAGSETGRIWIRTAWRKAGEHGRRHAGTRRRTGRGDGT